MKGITPVIALILLLVIVIVVVGFSFGIFQSIISSAGTAAEGQATDTSGRITQTVTIEAVDKAQNRVSVRNSGSDVPVTTVAIYVAGVYQDDCTWDTNNDGTFGDEGVGTTDDILAGKTATCDWSDDDTNPQDGIEDPCTAGTAVRVTSPSGATDDSAC